MDSRKIFLYLLNSAFIYPSSFLFLTFHYLLSIPLLPHYFLNRNAGFSPISRLYFLGFTRELPGKYPVTIRVALKI